jgi:hypothetical protein
VSAGKRNIDRAYETGMATDSWGMIYAARDQ